MTLDQWSQGLGIVDRRMDGKCSFCTLLVVKRKDKGCPLLSLAEQKPSQDHYRPYRNEWFLSQYQ